MKIQNFRFENVCFRHGCHDPVLHNSDFTFPEGSVVWLQSEEGEGKSTLLQILACLELPHAGSYIINEFDVREMTFEEFLPLRLRIGYSFDYGGLLNNLTLRANLLLPLQYHKLLSPEKADQRVQNLITRFGMESFADERPAHVPGRMRKLTCLLRSLIHYPDLLVMDDPFVGLGQETADNFVGLVKELREMGHLSHVVLSSYDERFVRPFQPKIVHLDKGQLYLSVVDGGSSVVNL